MSILPFGFEKEYNIRFYDCDYNGNVKIAAVPVSYTHLELSEYCLPFVKIGGFFVALKVPELNE